MSNAKSRSPTPKRVSLSMLKGRPGSLSVPSFSFRFNPTDEEGLEEVCELGEDVAEEKDSTTHRFTPSPPPSPATAAKNGTLKSKKSKRTHSLDGSDSPELTATADTWSIFSEIRGKIVRTVEEAKNRIDQHVRKDPDKDKNLERGGSTEIAEDALERNGEETGSTMAVGVDDTPECMDTPMTTSELRYRKNLASTSDLPAPLESGYSTFEEEPAVMDVGESATSHLPESSRPTLPKKMLAFIIFLLLLNLLLPLPDYLNGLVTGVVVVLGVINLWHSLTRPPARSLSASGSAVSRMPQSSKDRSTAVVHKVWMNELLSDYSPDDFHIVKTQSVLVRLDGTTLRLSYPSTKIPKRAMWNEPIYKPTFIYQRLYYLEGAKVTLIPQGLARKRHWSRRYPICIFLLENGTSREAAAPAHLVKENDKRVVLLFARSGREKEEWFWKLDAASAGGGAPGGESEGSTSEKLSLEYGVYMARLILSPTQEVAPALASEASPVGGPESDLPNGRESVAWLNALLGRGFWNVVHDCEWSSKVAAKIQRKLSMIRVPSFIEELRLSDIELGQQLPQVLSVGSPVLDERGLWLDLEVSYYGAFQMTLETKLNLMRLKRDVAVDYNADPSRADSPVHVSSYNDDEAEESVESSSDEEPTSDSGEPSDEVAAGASTTGRKILKLVDSIAQSRYFQHATEYKYVKKAMEGVSNTPLMLTVELVSLSGTLVVNVPPPPSDRLWYGFRGNPNLCLVAKPKVGEREVPFTQIIEWIEKKLVLEFQRILVVPNMDDFILPFASLGSEAGSGSSPQKGSSPSPTGIKS